MCDCRPDQRVRLVCGRATMWPMRTSKSVLLTTLTLTTLALGLATSSCKSEDGAGKADAASGGEDGEKQDDEKVQSVLTELQSAAHEMAAKLYEGAGGQPGAAGVPGADAGGDAKKNKGDVIDAEFEETN